MSTTSDLVTLFAVAVMAGTGAIIDARTRRIPNALTLATAVTGIGLAVAGATGVTMTQSVLGIGLGVLLMLPGHLLGATGAGDVKLLASAGAILGARLVPIAFVYTLIAGGVLACAVAIARGSVHQTLHGTRLLVASPGTGRPVVRAAGRQNRFPYAPAIAIGCLLAAIGV